MRAAAVELTAGLTPEEVDDVVDDVQTLLDAQASGVIDLSPALEHLLLDLLEQTVARR